MSTKENLEKAFAGESQSNIRYQAFAEQAEAEGFANVAKIFSAAAEAERIHAKSHLQAMNETANTANNLRSAIKGESFEYKVMYQEYIEQARNEAEGRALASFKNAMSTEQVHYSLYISALEAVDSGKDIMPKKIFVCNLCGNTVLDKPPASCPVCGGKKKKFNEIE